MQVLKGRVNAVFEEKKPQNFLKIQNNVKMGFLNLIEIFNYFVCSPEVILRVVSIIHIVISPLTKVEESFNLQAIHDILFYGNNIDKYDHLEFSGVVPRTFIGPLVISAISYPFVILSQLFYSKFVALIIVRICISEVVIGCFGKLRQTLSIKFGSVFAIWFVLIQASQFHFMYYMGRTLPNVFSLPTALLAINSWMCGNNGMFILYSAFTCIVFRAELAILFGIMLLFELFCRRISIFGAIKYAIPSGLFCIITTVAIDSLFWKRLVWPEAEVFWFNTILNQSHKWGTQPFAWYFYSAIPRALASSTFFILFGFWKKPQIRPIIFSSIIFVFLFSFLPHKELRFIFIVFPILNIAVASACDYLWKLRGNGFFQALVSVGLIFQIVLNGVISTSMLIVSSQNYPGGEALLKLHQRLPNTTEVNLHIDVYSAQNGVSRFLELSPNWKYDKTENLEPGGKEMLKFDYLFIGTMNVEERFIYYKTHEVYLSEEGFLGLDVKMDRYPPIVIKTEPRVLILKKNLHSKKDERDPYD